MKRQLAERERRMRVSYLFSQFPLPTEAFAISDIAALRELGHEVVVHTMKWSRRDEAERLQAAEVPHDLAVARASRSLIFVWPFLLLRNARVAGPIVAEILGKLPREPKVAVTALLCLPRALEISDEIARLNSDVVHLFWSRYSALVLRILEFKRAPQIRSAFVGAYDLVADDFLVQCAINAAHCVFTHSKSNESFLSDKIGSDDQVVTIHRGIPLITLDEAEQRDSHTWLTASALVKEKNVDLVIEAFARARTRTEGLQLVICGDGPERKALEQLTENLGCSKAVKFEGHVERSQVFAMTQRAQLFLMLSTKPSERLPNVIKEAMWGGCAIIASQTQGIDELIIDDQLGAVVDPDDTKALDAAIDRAMNERPDDAQARRLRARSLIEDNFSSINAMGRYVDQWRAAATTSPAAEALLPIKFDTN